MAQINQYSPRLFMVALLLVAAAAPLAHGAGLLPSGNVLNAITVNGSLCCAANGHCPDGPPLAGIKVKLVCTIGIGSPVTVGECYTGHDGSYFISVTDLIHTVLGSVTGLLGGILGGGTLPCRVVIDLPINQLVCQELSAVGGILYGFPKLINTLLSPLLGLVGCFKVTVLAVSH